VEETPVVEETVKPKKSTKKSRKRKREENTEANGQNGQNGKNKKNGKGEQHVEQTNGGEQNVEEQNVEEQMNEEEQEIYPKKKKRKVNESFRRIASTDAPILSDYKIIKGDQGAKRVNKNLKNVKGDRFRHEKTKKKRSYKIDGNITLGVHSTKLDTSSDDD